MAAALEGLNAYQRAPRTPRADEMPVVARKGRARLLDYGGDGPVAVFMPSLINPPHILDLTPQNSMLRWLARSGIRPMLIDWGAPEQKEHKIDVAGHVERLAMPMIASLGEPVHLVGYCLGGTMAAAAAQLGGARSLTMIAAPWRFGGFPDEARDGLAQLWDAALPTAERLGALPMEVLQSAFWQLDPARTIGKFERFARLDPGSEAAKGFVALEDWANDGPPLTLGAARELVEDLFSADITGSQRWRVGGETIDPHALPCPMLDIVSSSDRIVPEASAARAGEVWTLGAGHVGMVVGGRAEAILWRPLAEWLSQTHKSY